MVLKDCYIVPNKDMSEKLYIMLMPILSVVFGYLLSKVEQVEGSLSPFLAATWQLPVLLSLVLLLMLLIPYNYLKTGDTKEDSAKTAPTEHEQKPKLINKTKKPLEFSNDQVSILKVFRENDGELTSVPFIQQFTGLETIIVNTILDDFEKYDIVHATNLDEFEGGWQYQLSDKGRKTILKLT